MTERLIGETGSKKRRRFLLLPLVLVSLVALFVIAGAQAVHDDGFFQLDRNALTSDPGSPATLGDDWDRLDDGAGDPNNDDSARASTFTHEVDGATIFTGGGSKDDLNTTGWKHKSGSVPDKDDLLDAYAARYGNNIYFGADRIDNSGDAAMGFWFFQNEIVAQPDGSFGPDAHTNGDILVLSDFSGGGSNVTIRVYQWQSPGGAINGTLNLIAGTLAQTADCVGPPSVPAGDNFCGTVNRLPTASPWPFVPKGSAAGTFQPGEFYEGGIDLTFLNLQDACFSSFLAETRSSTSVNATLKDFVGGSFEPCEASVTTTPSDANGDPVESIVLGGSIHDHALIEGTGSTQNPTGTVDFWICAPDELTNGTCAEDAQGNDTGTFVSTNDVDAIIGTSNGEALSDAYTPDAIGTWCWRGEYSGDTNYPAATDASTGECFEVTDVTTTSTAQNWRPNDSATITATGASALAGSVAFTLYDNGTCDGNVLYTESVPVSGTSPQTVNTTNDGSAASDVLVSADATVSWSSTFTSTNDVGGSSGPCESSSLVIDNDTTD